jgi:hypothetical protein
MQEWRDWPRSPTKASEESGVLELRLRATKTFAIQGFEVVAFHVARVIARSGTPRQHLFREHSKTRPSGADDGATVAAHCSRSTSASVSICVHPWLNVWPVWFTLCLRTTSTLLLQSSLFGCNALKPRHAATGKPEKIHRLLRTLPQWRDLPVGQIGAGASRSPGSGLRPSGWPELVTVDCIKSVCIQPMP